MSSVLVNPLAALALLFAALSGLVVGTQAASSASPAETHTVGAADTLVGHQPTQSRASISDDHAEAPDHGIAPWTHLAIEPTRAAKAFSIGSVDVAHLPATAGPSYDITTPHGRAPPR